MLELKRGVPLLHIENDRQPVRQYLAIDAAVQMPQISGAHAFE